MKLDKLLSLKHNIYMYSLLIFAQVLSALHFQLETTLLVLDLSLGI